MAIIPNTFVGGQIVLEIDATTPIPTPPVYKYSCLANLSREISFTNNVVETEIPDCDSPLAPARMRRFTAGHDLTFTATGILSADALPFWRTWVADGQARAVRIRIYQDVTDPAPAEDTDVTITGNFILRSFSFSGDRAQFVTANIDLAVDGAYAFSAEDTVAAVNNINDTVPLADSLYLESGGSVVGE